MKKLKTTEWNQGSSILFSTYFKERPDRVARQFLETQRDISQRYIHSFAPEYFIGSLWYFDRHELLSCLIKDILMPLKLHA